MPICGLKVKCKTRKRKKTKSTHANSINPSIIHTDLSTNGIINKELLIRYMESDCAWV